METDDIEILICDCGSFEHQAVFWLNKDCGEEMYMYVHLITYRNFFKRLWAGLEYAFGHKSRFGEFDQFIFSPESEKKLFEFIERRRNWNLLKNNMKIQLDTTAKIIRVEEKVNLGELTETLEKLLPGGLWKQFSLETNVTI
jgi:hypothetical protein